VPVLKTQHDFRELQRLPFCYLCGQPFATGEKPTRDHMPPTALFRREDRDFPLILPTHHACNACEHVNDEMVGLLIGSNEGWPEPPHHRLLDAQKVHTEAGLLTLTKNLDIPRFVRRCLRAFHAALYHEWLPPDTANAFHPPLRGCAINPSTGAPADHLQESLLNDDALGQHARFVEALKKNRIASCVDRVTCRNGACVFDVVWIKLDDGRPAGLFGLKIYNWHRYGERLGYPPRGCVGMYFPKWGCPARGTRETDLVFRFSNQDRLNPFGD
jgi:hypothetical protein